MVKEYSLYLMEVSMWGNISMGIDMVKEHSLSMMEKYVGEFIYGKPDGQGTFTLPNGRKNVGEWRFGKGWNTTNYDKEGNTLGKYVNGKWIKN